LTKPAPYAADVRAKGWRFEVDYEKVKASDTWLRAKKGDVRGALLLLWAESWQQTPCGSLPDDDELIALLIDMSPAAFAKNKAVLMRGWTLADDGRLYHETITERVLEMLEYRRKNAQRVANHTAKKKQSRATNALAPEQQHGNNDTGTGTGTYTHPDGCVPRASAGEACKAMKSAGMADVSPSHPKLLALLEAGITLPELTEAARDAMAKSKPFAYALATAEGRRRDSATTPLPAAGNGQRGAHKHAAAAAAIFDMEPTGALNA
jgi:uncharacterized protein YdaU (DUF1376 family)